MPRTSTERRLVAACLLWTALAALRLAAPAPSPTPGAASLGGAQIPFGVPERSATLAWWQTGRAWAAGDTVDPSALSATVVRIGDLDPTWRTPWIYGGLMLQALDAPSEAEALLEEGAYRWPDDPWFPAALGVHLQDRGRVDEARRWLRAARERS